MRGSVPRGGGGLQHGRPVSISPIPCLTANNARQCSAWWRWAPAWAAYEHKPYTLSDSEQCAAVFRVVEVGSGTGGLTKDALPLLDAGLNAELLTYTATDITNAFSSSLLDAVKSPKLQFKVIQNFLSFPSPVQLCFCPSMRQY